MCLVCMNYAQMLSESTGGCEADTGVTGVCEHLMSGSREEKQMLLTSESPLTVCVFYRNVRILLLSQVHLQENAQAAKPFNRSKLTRATQSSDSLQRQCTLQQLQFFPPHQIPPAHTHTKRRTMGNNEH